MTIRCFLLWTPAGCQPMDHDDDDDSYGHGYIQIHSSDRRAIHKNLEPSSFAKPYRLDPLDSINARGFTKNK